MSDCKELTIYDFEDLWYAATELVFKIIQYCTMFDEEGNFDGGNDERFWMWPVIREKDPRFKYLNFRTCEELKQYSFADVCELGSEEIKEKYLHATLPIFRKVMRSGNHYLLDGCRVSDDIPDAYLDQLFAMAWKTDLKMWALQWENEKAVNKKARTELNEPEKYMTDREAN